jgi:hypothetical protein|tara:strand:- start:764 stop:1438 length:675 start_codon:yes stop_codon:yes gene_type:complete
MPTINLNKGGNVVGTVDTTQAAARDEAVGTSTNTGTSPGVQYFASPGRGGGTYRYIRTFLQFDSSGITGTVSAAVLNIAGAGTTNNADIIVCASDAFGGTNANLVVADFNNVDFSTAYSSELATWNNNGNNAITLNAAARSIIQSGNSFICAVIDHDSDFQDTDTQSGGAGSHTVSINFGGTITLDCTLAATGYTHTVMGVAPANIEKVIGVATADIEKIIGVD